MTTTTRAKMEETIRLDSQCICTFMMFFIIFFYVWFFKLDGSDTEESLLPKANRITDLQDTLIGFYVTLSAAECCPSLGSVLELLQVGVWYPRDTHKTNHF